MAITAEQAQPGVKVKIPTQKTGLYPCAIENSFEVNMAKERGQPFLFIVEMERGSVVCSNVIHAQSGDCFSPTDLDLYEEPFSFTVENQPFHLKGTPLELADFRRQFRELGFRSHWDSIREGMGILVNLEPDYPPYLRLLYSHDTSDFLEVSKVGEQLLAAAKEHATKLTKAPINAGIKASVSIGQAIEDGMAAYEAAAQTTDYYNGTEVFEQMVKLYGKEAVRGFCQCNSFKYRARAGKKPGNTAESDIEKALWYERKLADL